jgi:hypothetical protein
LSGKSQGGFNRQNNLFRAFSELRFPAGNVEELSMPAEKYTEKRLIKKRMIGKLYYLCPLKHKKSCFVNDRKKCGATNPEVQTGCTA